MLSQEIMDQLRAAIKSQDLELLGKLCNVEASLTNYWYKFWYQEEIQQRLFLVLMTSARTGYLAGVKFAVGQGLPITATAARTNISALHLAAQKGHDEVVGYILSNGGEALLYLEAGEIFNKLTPLGFACLNKKIAAAKKLLEIEPEKQVNAKFTLMPKGNDFLHASPMSLAVDRGDAEMVDLLTSKGADVKVLMLVRSPFSKHYPLFSASMRGESAVVNVLLNNGALPDDKPREELPTALEIAVFNGHITCARLLLEAGADPHIAEKLIEAIKKKNNNNQRVLDLLTEWQAKKPVAERPAQSIPTLPSILLKPSPVATLPAPKLIFSPQKTIVQRTSDQEKVVPEGGPNMGNDTLRIRAKL